MTAVKVCGVTIAADAIAAATWGARFLGINLWPGSARYVPLSGAAPLVAAIRAVVPDVSVVGVFVDAQPETIAEAVRTIGLDVVQLHGAEPPADCSTVATLTGVRVWKAVQVRGSSDTHDLGRWPVDAILLDAPSPGRGGSGTRFDWTLARAAVLAHPSHRILLAGGLTPENVGAAIGAVAPWAVDVASGVEREPGVKDLVKLRAFLSAAQAPVEPG